MHSADGTKKRKTKGSAFQTISAVHRVDKDMLDFFYRMSNFRKNSSCYFHHNLMVVMLDSYFVYFVFDCLFVNRIAEKVMSGFSLSLDN